MSKKTTFVWSILASAACFVGCTEEKIPMVFSTYVEHEPNKGGVGNAIFGNLPVR